MSDTRNEHPTSPLDPQALAAFAFATGDADEHASRSLAWLPPEELEIDLSDPAQRRFGDYELTELLGRGGMGVVYRAHQHSLDRDVALKLLAAGPWASDEFVARFRQEARSAARMQHPNIVEIYEIGSRDGLHFFSMRLVEGRTLDQMLRERGPQAPKAAAQLLRTVAEAVDYAHRLGVLHLDLKPGNILIDANETPLVADFGLARQLDGGTDGPVEEISGTPSYMAPEQAQLKSHPLSAATDIYGLGAIFYELLTGAPPFRGPTPRITLEQVIHRSPTPPRQSNRSLPADLEAICLKCLEKDPRQRYAGARALIDDLNRFIDGRPVSVHRLGRIERLRRWTRREPRLALISGLLLLALIDGLVTTSWQWQRAETALEAARVAATRTGQLTDLFAAIYPEPDAAEKMADPAGAAVRWLMQEMAGQDSAQAELLQGMTTALLKAGKSESADTLLVEIHLRLGQDVRGRVVDRLAVSDDPAQRMLAAIMAQTLPDSPQRALGDAALVRAAREQPNDTWVLLVAGMFCEAGDSGHCAVPDAARRLIAADPQNLLGYALSLRDPTLSTEAEHALLLQAARHATRNDDGVGSMIMAMTQAYTVSGEVIPAALARSASSIGMLEDSRNVAAYLNSYRLPWMPPIQALGNACDSKRLDPDAYDLRDACIRIGQVMATGRSVNIANRVGWHMLQSLDPESEAGRDAARRIRQFQWLQQQGTWSLSRDPALATPEYLRDMVEFGEYEADLRRVSRLKIPSEPPADWQPPT